MYRIKIDTYLLFKVDKADQISGFLSSLCLTARLFKRVHCKKKKKELLSASVLACGFDLQSSSHVFPSSFYTALVSHREKLVSQDFLGLQDVLAFK